MMDQERSHRFKRYFSSPLVFLIILFAAVPVSVNVLSALRVTNVSSADWSQTFSNLGYTTDQSHLGNVERDMSQDRMRTKSFDDLGQPQTRTIQRQVATDKDEDDEPLKTISDNISKMSNKSNISSEERRHHESLTMTETRKNLIGAAQNIYPEQSLQSEHDGKNPMSKQLEGEHLGKHLVVWTYPLPPLGNESSLSIAPNEILFCAYQNACSGLEYRHINLRTIAAGTPYMEFVMKHMLLKVAQGRKYSDHVQSVTILSLASKADEAVYVRSYGDPDVILWRRDVVKYSYYDPTKYNATAPFVPRSRPDLHSLDFLTLQFKRGMRGNSGDEIQDLTGVQFQPFISGLVNRDYGWSKGFVRGNVIANSWYGDPFVYPIGLESRVNFTMVSIHYSNAGKIFANRTTQLEFLRKYTETVGPIGARDTATLQFLKDQLKLPAFLSRCLTLMLQLGCACNDCPECQGYAKKDEIVMNDVVGLPKAVEEHLKANHNVTYVTANMHFLRSPELFPNTFEYAFNLLEVYAKRAKLVITSRLHTALPATALGVPVIFVKPPKLPGGGGNRLAGIYDILNVYEAGTEWTLDPDNPPPNPGVHTADRNRAAFWNYLKRRSCFYEDTARLHGMIPLRRLGRDWKFPHLHPLFHFTLIDAVLPWQFIRAIEFVFHHHPGAKVYVHTNSIPMSGSRLNVFAETGYNLEVVPYNLTALWEESWGDSGPRLIPENLSDDDSEDLVGLLSLYKHGGVYLRGNTFLQRPLSIDRKNLLGISTSSSGIAILIAEVRSIDLARAITKSTAEIVQQQKYGIRQRLSVSIVKSGNLDSFETLAKNDFDPFQDHWEDCFTIRPGWIDSNQSLAVHLDSHVLKKHPVTLSGTACDEILYKYCIFCDELHSDFGSSIEVVTSAAR